MKERNRIIVRKANIVVGLFMVAVLMSSQLLVGCTKLNDLNETAAAENNTDQEIEYIDESSGYAITLPKNLMDRVVIEKNSNTVYIASKMIMESDSGYEGILIFINTIPKSEYPNRQDLENYIKHESPVPLFVIGETRNDYICYSPATDVQYPPDDEVMTNEYKELTSEFTNEFTDNDYIFRVIN